MKTKKNQWVPLTIRFTAWDLKVGTTHLFEVLFGTKHVQFARGSLQAYRQSVALRFGRNLDRLTLDPQFQKFAVKLLEGCDTLPYFCHPTDPGYIAVLRAWYLAKTKDGNFSTDAGVASFTAWAAPKLLQKFRKSDATIYQWAVGEAIGELGAGGAALMNGGATSVQLLAKIALRELSQRNIRCVLLDEADQWVTLTLAGLISLFDVCREKDYPVTLIVAGAQRPEQWLGALPAMRSRTLHVETSSNLDPTLMASVLKGWSEPLARLVAKNDAGEKAAAKVIARIHKGTNGNFRRLSYFAELSKQEMDRAIDLPYVAEVLAKMKNQ